MGGVIITLTWGMSEPTYRLLQTRCHPVLVGVWDVVVVGVSVPKPLLLDTWVCAVVTFSQ